MVINGPPFCDGQRTVTAFLRFNLIGCIACQIWAAVLDGHRYIHMNMWALVMSTFLVTAVSRRATNIGEVTRGDLRALAGAANGWSHGLSHTGARMCRLSRSGLIKMKEGRPKITFRGRIIARLERAFDDYA